MNPFNFARSIGYNPKEILSFFAKQIPGFDSKVSQALAAGYTTEQVLDFLKNQFQGSKVDKRTALYLDPIMKDEAGLGRRGKEPPRAQLSQGIAPLAAGALGAAAGGLVGGPAAALQGAIAGATSAKDLLRSYDQHVAQGGSMQLSDFLKAAAKGAGSAAAAKAAMEMVGMLETGKEEQPDVNQDVKPLDIERVAVQEDVKPDIAPATETSITAEKASDWLSKAGVLNNLKTLSENNPISVLQDVAISLLGNKRVQALETASGLSIPDLVQSAFSQQPQPQSDVKRVDMERVASQENVKPLDIEQVQQDVKPLDELTKQAIGNTLRQGLPRNPISDPRNRRVEPIAPVDSSTLRSLFYDPKQKYAQALFANGSTYEYFGVPQEVVSQVMKGADTTTTEGESAFRAFYRGKNPSVGAAFDEYIKKGGYEYAPIDDEKIRDRGMRAIQKADRVHRSADYTDAFAEIFERAKGKQQIPSAEIQAVASDMDDRELEDMILEIRLELKRKNKQREKEGKRRQLPKPKKIAQEIQRRRASDSKRSSNNPKKAPAI